MTVRKRNDLEAALAKAEGTRIELETALAKAKAALVNTVTNAAKVDADREEANAKVLWARARCRELRAALLTLDRLEFARRSSGWIHTFGEQLVAASRPEVVVSAPSNRYGAHAVFDEDKNPEDQPRRRKRVSWPGRRFGAQSLSPDAHLLLRRTLGFLGLTLAYLQYYYFEVEIEILSLRSVTIMAFW